MSAIVEPLPISIARPASRRGEMTRDFLRRLWKSPSARIGGFLVLMIVGISIGVTTLDDYDARRDNNLGAKYAEPDCIVGYVMKRYNSDPEDNIAWDDVTCTYPFGADKNGRDITRRVGHGLSVSLRVSLFTVAIALGFGASMGLVAGFRGG